MADPEKLQALWDACSDYIRTQKIGCPEKIYQTDKIWETAPELVEKACEIVGYHVDPDEQ